MEAPGAGDVAHISEKMEKSLCVDSNDKLETYNRLVQEAKDAARGGDLLKALDLFKKAYNIQASDKIKRRIQKIRELLAENESENDDEEFINVNNSGLLLFKDLHDKLYDYQKKGVAFLYSLFRDGRKGGILADDMGLGKTIQVISFLSGMYDAEHVKYTMLVVPTSLITNWTKEFAKWTPGMRVKEFHGTSKCERTKNLEKVQRRGGVIITTYNMLHNNWQILASYQGKEFTWDYMILDEAHKIKTTTTKSAKTASAIPSKNRVLLTGTPVQNNLREMWALFDFACQGTLLGTAKTFKSEYENSITRAREKDATPGEKALGLRMSENLMATIKPYFLRRTKAEVQNSKQNGEHQSHGDNTNTNESVGQNVAKTTGGVIPTLTRKNDLIVWTYLSDIQEEIYRQFLSSDHIKELLMTTKSPLAQLTMLKKLCDHPRLLSAGAMAKLGLDENEMDGEEDGAHDITNVPDVTLISESGKMVFLFTLLERLKEEGHRTLVFAHYRKVLDILERILKNRGFKVMRMDGTITHTAERERRITLFQKDQSYTVFLLTTQVGGVGITLTAANRVVIYDPSWNPATDAQAVDRAYRIGQKENVVIYRLITCGTVEEKIYRRQVFKDSLIRQNTGDKKNPFRYFSKQELKELFTLEETKSSTTQLQLQALHSGQRRTDPDLDEHIAHLHSMEMFGISDHDLMFSVNVNHEEAPEDHEEYRYIEGRVQKAQELMKAESELQMQLAQSMSSSTEPVWLRMTDQQQRERTQEKRPKYPTQSPPPASSYYKTENIVDLDQTGSGNENENKVIDLTVEQSSEDVKETSYEFEKPIIKERNSTNYVLISDDEIQYGGFQNQQNVKQERRYSEQNGGDSVNGLEKMDNAECSMNNYLISDELQENGLHQLQNGDSSVNNSQHNEPEPQTQNGFREINNMAQNGGSSVKHEMDEFEEHEHYSMNNLVIEDSLQEEMETSTQNQNLEQKSENRLDNAEKEEPKANGVTLDSYRSLAYFTAEDTDKIQLNGSKHEHKKDLGVFHRTPLKNKRLSMLQASQSSFRTPNSSSNSSKISNGMESLEGDFNLQLDEDSDMFSDHDIFNNRETEAEEKKVLSKLRLDGSFDVDKMLVEHQNKSQINDSANDSIVAISGKKRVARIYDSDDEEEPQEEKDFEGSFHMLGASTPKAAQQTLNRSQNGIGANTSVASRRSFMLSLIEDVDNQDLSEESEDEDSMIDSEAEAAEVGLTCEETETEPSGETLKSEEEAEEEENCSRSVEEESENLEESTRDAELASDELMEEFTSKSEAVKENDDNYAGLVRKGREFFNKGSTEEALSYFLKAIDIQPGDPEVQLMTIQLYRQLSQKK